uniref:Calbindin 2 n=1 Tax=Taeniopygia guttata TaxID=59729 RepID=A0A674HKX9_TAEGU
MAGPQQAPHLHLAELTASQFLDIWRHFDADGNGYIEGKELENFFQELESARKGAGVVRASSGFAPSFPCSIVPKDSCMLMSAPSPLGTHEWDWDSSGKKVGEDQHREWGKCSHSLSPCWQDSKKDNLGDKMKEFMHKYDKNADGKIEMAEVSSAGPDKPQAVHVPPSCLCFPLHLSTMPVFPTAGSDPAHGGEFSAVFSPACGLQFRVHGGEWDRLHWGIPREFNPAPPRENNWELELTKLPLVSPKLLALALGVNTGRQCWFREEQECGEFSQFSALLGYFSGQSGASSQPPDKDLGIFCKLPLMVAPKCPRDVPKPTLFRGVPQPCCVLAWSEPTQVGEKFQMGNKA